MLSIAFMGWVLLFMVISWLSITSWIEALISEMRASMPASCRNVTKLYLRDSLRFSYLEAGVGGCFDCFQQVVVDGIGSYCES